jgi:hypothetical protein
MNVFHKAMLIFAFAAPVALAAPATAAAPRHYDCSKPGNSNKTACKGTQKTSVPAATPARTTTTTSVTTKTTTRHYDCTKAGNANKAACRTAASETSAGKTTGAVKTTTKTTATTTDCTKWYNRLRATCRTTSSATPTQTSVAPAAKPAPANAGNRSASTGENTSPTGATAQCKDGTYSHAKTHRGACSHHGGVAKWMS